MYVKPFRIGEKNGVIFADYRLAANEAAGILLTADHHMDNPKCVRALLKKDHEDALKNDAMICAFGDIFCAMQGKTDKRHTKSDVLPENQSSDYLNSLVRTGESFYGKYARNYLMMSYGNHETGVIKKMEFDPLSALIDYLNLRHEGDVKLGKYKGWVILRFFKPGGKKDTPDQTVKIAYHHGYGGGGPVTKGVIQTNRRATYMPDADVIVTGHIHEKWIMSIPRERLDQNYNVKFDEQYHVQLPTYKEEYGPGKGWHIERGGPPKPLGGVMMEVRREYINRNGTYRCQFKPTFDMQYLNLMD